MSKNYLFALAAGIAILAAGCNKTDAPTPENGKEDSTDTDGKDKPGKEDKITSADFVGSWDQGELTGVFVLNADGGYTESRWGESTSGKWAYNEGNSTITFTPDGSEAWTTNVILIGGKAWMVFIDESDPSEEYQFRSTESFRKAGATVQSGTLGDGRWDAPHGGIKPAEYNEDADYSLCLVVAGNKVDLYVPMWGYHIEGTFTLEDGHMKITTDDDHIWAGKSITVVSSTDWSFGWNAWSEVDDCHSMNPETFELRGYTWYTVNQLKAMGHASQDDSDSWTFEVQIWEAAVQLHEQAMDLCNFDLCVAPDGKEAYGSSVGLAHWFYKR